MDKSASRDYIRLHRADYESWVDQEADHFIRTQWLLQLCLGLITLNNLVKGVNPFLLVPCSLLLLFGAGMVELRRRKLVRRAHSQWIWDVCCFFVIAGGLGVHAEVVRLDLPLVNAPVLAATFVATVVSTRPYFRSLMLRNLGLVAISCALGSWLIPGQLGQIVVQVVEGAGAGTFLAISMLRSRKERFYMAHLNVEQKHFVLRELSKIVAPHVRASIEAGTRLEDSMPVGFANACLISFDIIRSSRVTNPHFPAAVEQVMARCYDKMMENYDSQSVSSNAYRIKDMGDGFLCSVGFPYRIHEGASIPSVAIRLAFEFVTIFHEEMRRLQWDGPLPCCAVGIAQGKVEGFFPSRGVKQYDLRGRALVLAKRYESLRNLLIRNGETDFSYVILQEAIHQNLGAAEQALFDRIDAKTPGFVVRDDELAQAAFVARVQGQVEDQALALPQPA